MPGKGKFSSDDAWSKGADIIDLGNLGKKKEKEPASAFASKGEGVYIKAGAPITTNFTPMANMTRKYR